ncbi:TPA: autotransporter outer membrane beta-barrel domain-containing protein [Stenotrophomonas maltophilia]|nr:autotransporter outer membrane beta-barrel domain-containing protein [Stenotrophomonas maltophilia]
MNPIPHHRLARAISTFLLAAGASFGAFAGVVPPGGSATVRPGTPAESWRISDGGTLTLLPGAQASGISGKGTLFMDGATSVASPASRNAVQINGAATISGSTLTATTGQGLAAVYTFGGPVTVVRVSDSTIQSDSAAVLMGAQTDVSLSATTVTGGTTGIRSFGGPLAIQDGSIVRGGTQGLELYVADTPMTQPSQTLIDGSTVESATGAAIVVTSVNPTGPFTEAYIRVRNGSQLVGGNGNLLEVAPLPTSAAPEVYLDVQGSSLVGDILVAEGGSQAHVVLSNGGSLTGAFTNVTSASLDDGGRWQLRGNSDVGALTLNTGGVVALGDGSTFNTLGVDTFTGNGGTLLFNTVLGADDASTDRLHVLGDTRGSANVAVNNVGGAGAQTVDGIELIRVDGASNGQFALAGRAVGGQYEYFLFKGGASGAGNWYLRSQLPVPPDPCDADPTLPGCAPVDPPVDPIPDPDPVLRPEGGAYLANLTAAGNLFRLGYHDRQAGQNGGRGWARVDGSRNGFDAVSRQLDVRGNSQALSVGVDMLRGVNGSGVGLMLSSGNASSTSTNALTGYYARGKVKGEALGVYGTWRGPSEDGYAGFYIDGSVQRAQFRNRVEGVGLTPERYDSKVWQGAVETGYAFRAGGASNAGIYVEPQLQVGYNRWDDLRHTEANGTVVTTQDADGLYGRAGMRLSGVTRWGNGVAQVQPYIAAHWLHTRNDAQVRMDDEGVDARIPRSRGEFSGGASVKFGNGVSAWGGLSLQRASGYHQTSAQVGLSYAW